MIKAIIFDLGSVLFDEDWQIINAEMEKRFGILISSKHDSVREKYEKVLVGKIDMHEFFCELCREAGKDCESQEVCMVYKELYKKHKTIDKELLHLLRKLREHYKLACFSDTNPLHFESHEEQSLLDAFNDKFASFQIGMKKSEKGAFEHVLRKMNVHPEEAVFIDDSAKNIEVANSLGMKSILFVDYRNLVEDLRKLGVRV